MLFHYHLTAIYNIYTTLKVLGIEHAATCEVINCQLRIVNDELINAIVDVSRVGHIMSWHGPVGVPYPTKENITLLRRFIHIFGNSIAIGHLGGMYQQFSNWQIFGNSNTVKLTTKIIEEKHSVLQREPTKSNIIP